MNKKDWTEWGVVVFILFGLVVFGIVRNKFKDSNPERKFTPEQKAVLQAMRNATANVEKTKQELIQIKNQINDSINGFRAEAIQKGLNPNVHVSWIPWDGNGVNCAPNDNRLILAGFREDGIVVWKRP